MDKASLRKKYLMLRSQIDNRDIKDKNIYNKVINDDHVMKADTILTYVSYHSEVDTYQLINYFLSHGKKVAVPKVERHNLVFYYINSLNDLKKGSYGIMEPTTNEPVADLTNAVSLTPALCYTKDGNRLGYGGGYYDRYYENHQLFKIGLCYCALIANHLPTEVNDIRVDLLITEEDL